MTPTASIIIVNKNDEGIGTTLSSLQLPGVADGAELVVVDASGGRFDALRRTYPLVHWIEYQQPPERTRTIAQQRNLGVAASTAAVTVFLDANCEPRAGWLAALLKRLNAEDRVIVAGAVVSSGPASLHDGDEPHDLQPDGTLTECGTMNVAMPRAIFDEVGYFDETIGFAEDVDLVWRAQDAGYRIVFEPGAVIAHNWGTYGQDLHRAFRYGVGRVRLLRKHHSRWRNLIGVDRASVAYALFILGTPLAVVAPWYLLALGVPMWLNRGSHPVRTTLYGLANALGVLSELVHLPVTAAQRSARQ